MKTPTFFWAIVAAYATVRALDGFAGTLQVCRSVTVAPTSTCGWSMCEVSDVAVDGLNVNYIAKIMGGGKSSGLKLGPFAKGGDAKAYASRIENGTTPCRVDAFRFRRAIHSVPPANVCVSASHFESAEVWMFFIKIALVLFVLVLLIGSMFGSCAFAKDGVLSMFGGLIAFLLVISAIPLLIHLFAADLTDDVGIYDFGGCHLHLCESSNQRVGQHHKPVWGGTTTVISVLHSVLTESHYMAGWWKPKPFAYLDHAEAYAKHVASGPIVCASVGGTLKRTCPPCDGGKWVMWLLALTAAATAVLVMTGLIFAEMIPCEPPAYQSVATADNQPSAPPLETPVPGHQA